MAAGFILLIDTFEGQQHEHLATDKSVAAIPKGSVLTMKNIAQLVGLID